ncbi:MAG TPA: hypothetical protein VIK69_01080 [Methylophilaceae bacterium]
MALLDVTDIVCDPDFIDTLTLKRQTETIGTNGRATVATVSSTIFGVVCSDRGDILDRVTDAERVIGSIMVHTKATLRDGGAGATADILTWGGRDFTVAEVFNYSHFGRGFTAARCEPLNLEG